MSENDGGTSTIGYVNTPNELNSGTIFRNSTVWFLNIFNEFPAHEFVFYRVSIEFLHKIFDDPDWVFYNNVIRGGLDKKKYEERIEDGRPFSLESITNLASQVAFVNEQVGVLSMTKITTDKGILDLEFQALPNEKAENFIKSIHPYLNEEEEGKPIIHVVKKDDSGYTTRDFEVDHHELDFHKHYENSDRLSGLHDKILDNMNDDNTNQSFYIFHGDPGTGKTSYIKYLMTSLKKNVIYIPPHLIDMIADPHFVDFMADNANSVIVIEDAEDLVQKDFKRSNALSNLLNMTDGILGDCFKMDFICTFNKDVREIDDALIRNGRLNGIFKFTELSYEKAKKLCDEQGKEVPESGKRTLANIFGEEPEDVVTEEDLVSSMPVGFNKQDKGPQVEGGSSNNNGKNEYV